MPSHLDSLSSSPPSPTPTLNPSSFPPSAGAAGKPDPSSFSSFPLEKQGNDSSRTLDPSPLRSSLGSGDEKGVAAEMDTSKGGKDRKHDKVDGPDSTEREFDPAAAAVDEELYFPDGGVRAWAVVAGAFVSLLACLDEMEREKRAKGSEESGGGGEASSNLFSFLPSSLLPRGLIGAFSRD